MAVVVVAYSKVLGHNICGLRFVGYIQYVVGDGHRVKSWHNI